MFAYWAFKHASKKIHFANIEVGERHKEQEARV